MAGEVVDLLDRDAEERLLRIDFFPVVADSVEEEIEGNILGEHWGLEVLRSFCSMCALYCGANRHCCVGTGTARHNKQWADVRENCVWQEMDCGLDST
jgi:hypothetical protein